MDFEIRSRLLAKCKIGSVEFVAAAVSGGGERRLAGGGSIYNDGEEFEDLGENARTEILEAVVDEGVYLELVEIRRAAKPVVCTHPLFGIMWARLWKMPYKANEKQGVDITITLVEDGDVSVFLNVNPTSFPQASSAATAAASAFSESIDDLPDDITGDLFTEATACAGFIDGFTDALADAALGGIASVQSLSGAFGELVDAVDSTIDAFDRAAEDLASLVDSDLADLALSCVNAGRQAVDALTSASSTIWQPLSVSGPLGFDAVAAGVAESLGIDTDDAFDRILTSNPSLIDLLAFPSGATVWLPV
jgi:hypothetical protein